MATQSVEFRAVTGQTITAKLFTVGSDTEVASVTATEATNRKGTYTASFTDVAAGEYQLLAFNSAPIPVASWLVTLTLTTATFQVYDRVDKDGITRSNWAAATVDHTSTGSFGYVIGIFFSLIEFVTGWRFTAKAVELAGGDVTVIAAPISAEDVERVLGSTIRAFTGETGTVSVTIRDSNQALIDLTGKTLRMVFSINGNVVHRIVHADLDVAGSVVTFSKSLAITGGPGEVDWSLFEVGKDALAHGVMYVNKIPY